MTERRSLTLILNVDNGFVTDFDAATPIELTIYEDRVKTIEKLALSRKEADVNVNFSRYRFNTLDGTYETDVSSGTRLDAVEWMWVNREGKPKLTVAERARARRRQPKPPGARGYDGEPEIT